MAGYDHRRIDAHWQAYWDREQTFKTPTDRTRPKYYVLDMFPYPSGDPAYYKWTQWIFNVLFDRGLAYRAEVPVNFCPALGTVLANEEVKDGAYIETGDPVEKRLLRQWMLKITDYADRLSEDLEGL